MAVVVSVSVPDDLKKKWDRSNLKISPSQIFQIALETQLDGKNKSGLNLVCIEKKSSESPSPNLSSNL